jgi:hypothetical protein
MPCWDQWLKTPRNINPSISQARSVNPSISQAGSTSPSALEPPLRIVDGSLASFDDMNLGTAIASARWAMMGGWCGIAQIAAGKRFLGLLNRICEMQLSGRSTPNIPTC